MSTQPSDPHHDMSRRRASQPNRSHFLWIIGIFLGLLLLGGGGYRLYSLGRQQGGAQSIASPTPTARAQRTVQPTPVPTPATTWMLLGSVTSTTNTSVTIKMANGESQTFRIDSKTTVQANDQTAITIKDLKVGSRIIATGVYTKDRALLTQKIRLTL